ncbi:MAG: hypothetical protein IH611_11540, partial [Deltaproteobacteria bacterium]|nr:hypothetical protein [Deltaproteobacteria bacterium]
VLVPRRCFDRVGLFDERLKVSQDYDLWFRMSRRYPFVHVPEILVRSRVHPGQGTRSMTETCLAEGNSNFISWLDEIALELSSAADPALSRFLLRAAVRLKRRGYFPAAAHALSLYRAHARSGSPWGGAKAILADRYFAVCERPWATFLPRAIHALSDTENLAPRIRRRIRGSG